MIVLVASVFSADRRGLVIRGKKYKGGIKKKIVTQPTTGIQVCCKWLFLPTRVPVLCGAAVVLLSLSKLSPWFEFSENPSAWLPWPFSP